MTTIADRSAPKSGYTVVGSRPIRHDGVDKVTGRARYGADVRLPDALHGKILRSPHGHARIVSIDASRARALPGVKAVVTGADVPIVRDTLIDYGETMGNARLLAENCLARDKVLYKGHAVAAVAAANPHVAEEALDLIEVEYEPLPVVLTALDAMREDAPLLHEAMTTRSIAERWTRGDDTGVHSNVASHLQFRRGDLEEGFAAADAIVEFLLERHGRARRLLAVAHGGVEDPHMVAIIDFGHRTVLLRRKAGFSRRRPERAARTRSGAPKSPSSSARTRAAADASPPAVPAIRRISHVPISLHHPPTTP